MKKLLALTIVFIIVFSSPALAVGELIVTGEKYYIGEYRLGPTLQFFVEITNISDKTIICYGGFLEALNQEGNTIELLTIPSSCPPVLGPGEIGYIFDDPDDIDEENKNNITSYMLTVAGKVTNYRYTQYLPSLVKYGIVEKFNGSEALRISVTVTNDTNSTLYDIKMIVALYDSNDNLYIVDSIYQYGVGVIAGQSAEFYNDYSTEFFELWKAGNTNPGRIEAIAYLVDDTLIIN